MDFKVIVTSKEKKCICLDGFLYRFDQTLKIGDLSWRCTVKNCNARIKTDSGTSNILSQKNDHNHEQCDDRKIERHQLRVYAKRKAADDLTQRPSKIIRAGLKDVGEDSLHPKDLKSVSKAMYRVRRKSQPNLPKSREEVHTLFEGYPVQTSKFENFLQVNDRENGIIIFTCTTNLECLCYVEEIFMDGTFKFCPKFFNQLYTIHGFKNGNYIPLVFILLTGKSEEIYHHCFTKLVELCNDRNLTLKPKTVHVDFEDRVMVVVRNLFPSALLKCCRFHLSQAWWRKIQALGLSKEYKECTTEVGKWLHKFFGLSFLPDADVEDSFVEDMMAEAPKEPRCSKFADYLTENYVTTESRFPPILWAEQPSYTLIPHQEVTTVQFGDAAIHVE
ncbi:unnamed protein product [Mytilus edulis]|uniref:MULE transposase domain-containing protein n=1 Tax=Mytilus edulis TaxID=6550 RepID=A0A8S3RID4_MYTED|nr:unnamed protein product [Mytilus edulis]